MSYYYAENQTRKGPVTKDMLIQLIKEEKIQSNTLIWTAGYDAWKPVAETEFSNFTAVTISPFANFESPSPASPQASSFASATETQPLQYAQNPQFQQSPQFQQNAMYGQYPQRGMMNAGYGTIFISPEQTIKRLQGYFFGLWLSIALLIPTLFFSGIGVCIFMFLLLFELWQLIPPQLARTTPLKAIGFSFIPFFNIYWYFVVFPGLAEDMNKALAQVGSSLRVNKKLCLAIAIINAICVVNGLLQIFFLPLFLLSLFLYILFSILIIPSFKILKDGGVELLRAKANAQNQV